MHVLIVEDNKKMAGLLKKGLEERNHSVTLAFDGCTGFEAAKSSDCAAVILDLMLPRMDGFEFLRRLRKNDDQLPILVLSARDGHKGRVLAEHKSISFTDHIPQQPLWIRGEAKSLRRIQLPLANNGSAH